MDKAKRASWYVCACGGGWVGAEFELDHDGWLVFMPKKEEEIFPGGQTQVMKCNRCEVRESDKQNCEEKKKSKENFWEECSIVALNAE